MADVAPGIPTWSDPSTWQRRHGRERSASTSFQSEEDDDFDDDEDEDEDEDEDLGEPEYDIFWDPSEARTSPTITK